ncbi:MAG: regulatory protein RecX [Coriobacteriia bacterium]|nr:regulatory protein RecX [Coriobacteriia bacterium]
MAASKQQTISELRRQMKSIESGGAAVFQEPVRPQWENCACEDPDGEFDARRAMDPFDLDEQQRAFARIESLFMHRDRSEHEMRTRLAQEDFTLDAIDHAVGKAKRCGLIDDARFADAFIRARIRSGKGNCAIEHDLRQRGVEPSSLPDWPYQYQETSRERQVERAFALLERQPPRSKNPLRSAYQKLVRKGYSSSVANEVAQRWFRSNFD